MKALHVGANDNFVEQLSRFLQIEHRMELLPEVEELSYHVAGSDDDTSVGFVEACKNASLLITLIRGPTAFQGLQVGV